MKENIKEAIIELSRECKKHKTEDDCVRDCPYYSKRGDCCFFDHCVSSWEVLVEPLLIKDGETDE